MRFLTLEEALRIHARVMSETPAGLIRHAGVRHLGAVDAALARAQWGPFDIGDIAERAALLVRGIAQDHPFEDGNKRSAYAIAFAFLDMNGVLLIANDAEVVAFMLDVARGEHDVETVADWLRAHVENV